MIDVSVKFFAALAEIMGEREITVSLKDESDFMDLINKITQKYRDNFQQMVFQPDGNLKETYKILWNESGIEEPKTIDIKLKNGDIISFLPPVGGGGQ